MAASLTMITGHMRVTLCASLLCFVAAFGPASGQAQEAEDKKSNAATSKPEPAAAEESSTEATEQVEEKDPFAVPADADAEELFEFIRTVKRNRGRTIESSLKPARAAVAGAEAIRKLPGVKLEDEILAIREQLGAGGFLERFDPASRGMMKKLLEELKNDKRPEIARIAEYEEFKVRIASAGEASKADQEQMVSDLKVLLADREFDRDSYSLAESLARSIGYSKNSEVAATLYEEMATLMSESKDESLRSRASKMLGAARRMRLPGNFMEVMGQTADGEVFDWEAYRGKVVLVDFWASWCGPCRAEVPNMKRNLEIYGEKGFEIVGVNLDRTLDACDEYVEKEELTWPNLMSDKDGERGWDNPLAAHYGISAIPTAILVDQEGRVVSLRARGKELDRLLAELLGEGKPSEDDSDPKAAEKSDS